MTSRGEQAAAVLLSVLMVISMIAGSVAFGGLAAADGSGVATTDNAGAGQLFETETSLQRNTTAGSNGTAAETDPTADSGDEGDTDTEDSATESDGNGTATESDGNSTATESDGNSTNSTDTDESAHGNETASNSDTGVTDSNSDNTTEINETADANSSNSNNSSVATNTTDTEAESGENNSLNDSADTPDSGDQLLNTTTATKENTATTDTDSGSTQADLNVSEIPGDGTRSNPYEISNVSELQAIEGDLDANYTLVTDIDASNTAQWNNGSGFDPIGPSFNNKFTGVLDGAGHTIDGLTINRSTEDRVGLIGVLDDEGTVRNVSVIDADITGNFYTGGLVGTSDGTVVSSSATGTVTSSSNNAGGLAGSNDGLLTESSAQVTVTGDAQIGGLVGLNAGTVRESYATGSVIASGDRVGGLVATNGDNATVSSSYATGTVTGNSKVGGLVGLNLGTTQQTVAVGSISGSSDVGGLVGSNTASFSDTLGTVEDSYFDEQTTGQPTSAGNATELTTAQMTGEAARTNMSGLDFNDVWTTTESYPKLRVFLDTSGRDGDDGSGGENNESAQVDVDPDDLLGDGIKSDPYQISNASELQAIEDDLDANYTLVTDIDASNTAQWNTESGFDPIGNASSGFVGTFVGNGHTIHGLTINRPSEEFVGLFGRNDGRVSDVHLADAEVVGLSSVGGIVGTNGGTIESSSVAGTVVGSVGVGGLTGVSDPTSSVRSSHTSGSVIGDSYVGGLIGFSSANAVESSHSTASVTGTSQIGGLTGINNGTVNASYATGTVEGSEFVGGLVGSNADTVKSSYATGSVNGSSRVGGLAGDNFDATIESSFAAGSVTGEEFTGGFVGTLDGGTITSSYATGNVTSDSTGGGFLGLRFDGTVTDSYWDQNTTGFSTSAGNATGLTTVEMTGVNPIETLVGFDFENTWRTTDTYPELVGLSEDDGPSEPDLTVVVDNSSIQPTTTSIGQTRTYTVSVEVAHVPDFGSQGEVDIQFERFEFENATDGTDNDDGDDGPDGDLTIPYTAANVSNGLLMVSAEVSATAPTTPGARDVTVTDLRRYTDSGTDELIADENVTIDTIDVVEADAGPVDVDPSNLTGSGTEADPYVVTNASELQAIEDDLDANYTLGTDIDASETAVWNDGSGFDPIAGFSGMLSGNGHTIHGLTIDRPTESRVGLIESNYGTVRNVHLTDATVTGSSMVGSLVGLNFGDGMVTTSSATGAVNGTESVGGLAGANVGSVHTSYAVVDVTGSDEVGGFVGLIDSEFDDGTVESSYAAGSVAGDSAVGGFIGENFGTTVRDSYWDLNATGQSTSAGNSTGLTTAAMTGKAAPGNMTALDFGTAWRVSPDGYPELAEQGRPELTSIPFETTFDGGLDGWTVDQRFRTGDLRDGSPTAGDGGFSSEYGGSVRLHVDGGPSSIGVARNTTGLPNGTRITARYESSTFTSEPGTIRLLLYPPGNYNQNEIQIAAEGDSDGVLSGIVPRDLPAGTQIRVTAAVWPGEYTTYVTNVTATEPPASIDLSLADDAIDNGSETSLTVNATLSNGTVKNVTEQAELRSTDEGVVRVTDGGTVMAEGVGTTTVNATYRGNSATRTITVDPASGDAPANFTVDIDESETETSIVRGGNSTVIANVTNTGGTIGTQRVQPVLENDTESIAGPSINVTLAPEETQAVEFGGPVPGSIPVGDYTLNVSSVDDTDTLAVDVVDSPANFVLDGGEYPRVVEETEPLEATASVINDGEIEDTQQIGLYVDGDLVNETTVTIAPGESREVTLAHDHNATHSSQLEAFLATEDEEGYSREVSVYDDDELAEPAPEDVLWTYGGDSDSADQEEGRVIAQDGTLFTTRPGANYRNHTLVALNQTTGKVVWERTRGEWMYMAGSNDDTLVVESGDEILGYDPTNGDVRWSVESTDLWIVSDERIDRQLAYGEIYATTDDKLIGIDTETGDVTLNVTGIDPRDVYRTHDTVYATESNEDVYALSLDGDVRWNASLDDYGGEIYAGSDETIAVETGSELVAYETGPIDPDESRERWRVSESDFGEYLGEAVSLDNGYLMSFETSDSEESVLVRIDENGDATTLGNVSGNYVEIYEGDTGLYVVGDRAIRLDVSTGERRWTSDATVDNWLLDDDRGYLSAIRSDEEPVTTVVTYDAVDGAATEVYGSPYWISGNTLINDVAYVTEGGTTRAIRIPDLDATDIAFAIDDVTVTDDVSSDGTVTVTATVTNTGDRSTVRSVDLDVVSETDAPVAFDSKPVTVPSNESTAVTFDAVQVGPDASGHVVTVSTDGGSETATVGNTTDDGPRFEVTGVDVPATGSVGSPITYTAEITNTGGTNGTQTVSASFAGQTVSTQSVSLDTGESRTIAFTTEAEAEGTGTAAVSTADDDGSRSVDVVGQEFVTGQSTGDPHITTFDGTSYDFMAAGDFVLAREPQGDLLVAARQSPVSGSVSNNNATGTLVGNSSVVIDAEAATPVSIDGQPVPIADGESVTVSDGAGRVDRQGNTYTVYYAGDDGAITTSDEHLTAILVGDRIDIELSLHPDRSNDVEGLLGDIDGSDSNDIAFANGTALDQPLDPDRLYDGFRSDWRATGDENPFAESYYDSTFPETVVTVSDLSEEERERAESVLADTCLVPGTPQYEDALIDVALTGDSSYVASACQVDRENVTDADDNSQFSAQNGLAATDGVIFVNTGETIRAIDYATRTEVAAFPAPDGSDSGLAYGNGSLWYSDAVSDTYDGQIIELDPESGDVRSRINTSGDIPALTYGNGSLWAADITTNDIIEFSPTGEQQNEFDVRDSTGTTSPRGLTFTNGTLWLGTTDTNAVHRFSQNGTKLGSIDPSRSYRGLAANGSVLFGPDANGNVRILHNLSDPIDEPFDFGVELQPTETASQGENATITAYPYNRADEPVSNATIELVVDADQNDRFEADEVVADRTVDFHPMESRTTTLVYDGVQLDAGTYEYSARISKEGETTTSFTNGTLTVDDPAANRTRLEVTGLTTPASASAGSPVTFTAEVTNTGGENGTQNVTANFAGQFVATRTVTLNASESRTVAFTAEAETEGARAVSVSTGDDDGVASVNIVGQEFVTGQSTGDPHITTFSGVSYDFMAAGDFVLAREPQGELLVSARQSPISDSVSNNNATATRVGDSRVVIDAEAATPVSIDGQATSIPDGGSVSIGDTSGRIDRQGSTYTVYYAGQDGEVTPNDEHLTVDVVGDRIDIELSLHPDRDKAVEGLFGSINGNATSDVTFANGTALDQPLDPDRLYGDFRSDWRATGDENPFAESYYDSTFPKNVVTVSDLSEEELERAESVLADTCLVPGTPQYEDALIDVALTGDSSYVASACQVDDENVTDADDNGTTPVPALSFERADDGQPPAEPWSLEKTDGTQRVSADRSTDGTQSLYLSGSSGLGESWATIDLNFTRVSTVRGDIYAESTSNSFGDIKVHIDDTNGKVMGATQKGEGQWHTDLEGNVSTYDGIHTLILRTRGDGNRAYFDNIRFYADSGELIPPEQIVVDGDPTPANLTVDIDEDASDTEVVPNGDLTVVANVTNTGNLTDTQAITAELDGTTVSETVELGEKQTELVSLTFENVDVDPGNYELTVGSDSSTTATNVTILQTASFEVTDPEPTDLEVADGENFTVSTNVTNTGDLAGEQVIELGLGPDDRTVATETLNLSGGVTEPATFEGVSVDDPGQYNYTVASEDDRATGSLTVTPDAAGPNTTVSVEPSQETVVANGTVTVDLRINTTENITSTDLVFDHDPDRFTVEDVEYGPFLESDGADMARISPVTDPALGTVDTAQARQSSSGIAGDGTLVSVTLRANDDIESGTSASLGFESISLLDESNEPVTVETESTDIGVPDEEPDVNVSVLSETVHANSTVDVRVDANVPAPEIAVANATLNSNATVVERTDRGNGTWLFTVEFNESTWSGGSTGSYAMRNVTATVTTDEGTAADATAETSVRLAGDVTGDGRVGLFDLRFLALAYDTTDGDEKYDADADLTNDGEIGVTDLSILGQNWRTTAWTTTEPSQLNADIAATNLSQTVKSGSIPDRDTDEARDV